MNVRLEATQYIWTAFAFAMAFLFGSTIFTDGGLSAAHVILGIFISGAVFISSGLVWNWGNVREAEMNMPLETRQTGKRKRLDAILDQLDAGEMQALRERLMLDDDATTIGLSDDGELIQQRRR